ncbi:hypothetical protein NQ315_002065 [Exocentrus adspersus]|uniref:Uncharacterized protein n=1 Tax=Exocentrus adspersus TaxID=1586481 RepID=A0AAV8VFQ3_9CUCU|nr:hypothetical protein NQ315_002065 [Exocentrus adspersus]
MVSLIIYKIKICKLKLFIIFIISHKTPSSPVKFLDIRSYFIYFITAIPRHYKPNFFLVEYVQWMSTPALLVKH